MSFRLLALALLVLSGCAELFVAPEHRAHVAGLEAQAQEGDLDATSRLAFVLGSGRVTNEAGETLSSWPRDTTRARALMTRVTDELRTRADAGDLDALVELAGKTYNGYGVRRDTLAAIGMWRAAAGRGHAEAMYAVGFFGERPRDLARAAEWYRRAYDAGHHKAAAMLHGVYRDGRGVEADTAEAVAWLERAAEAGNEWAVRDLRSLAAYRAGR